MDQPANAIGFEPPHRDRRTGLKVVGALLIVVGVLLVLIAVMMFQGPSPVDASHPAPGDQKGSAAAGWIFGATAAAFVWVGIGSIRARRWARALALTVSTSWLTIGILVTAMLAVVVPRMLAGRIPSDAWAGFGLAVLIGLMTVVFVAIPAVLVAFYRAKSVQATCEAMDPGPSWTDGMPASVLLLCIWSAGTALCMIPLLFGDATAVPFFGRFVSGSAAKTVYAVMLVVNAWCAWAIYRRHAAGWWATVSLQVVTFASWVITYLEAGPLEWVRQMGSEGRTPEQLDLAVGIQPSIMWSALLGIVVYLVFLVWTRKHFRRPDGAGA